MFMNGGRVEVQVHWVQIDIRSCRGGPDGEKKKSVMDAQLHADINIDGANPRLEMYHMHFLVLERLNVLNILSVLLGHHHRLGIMNIADSH